MQDIHGTRALLERGDTILFAFVINATNKNVIRFTREERIPLALRGLQS